MPRFTWKMNVFPSIFLEMPDMCVVAIRTGFCFSEMIDLISHMPRFTWKNECFSIHLLRNARNVCCNYLDRVCFSEVNRFDQSHAQVYLKKWMLFPSISLETPYMCVETHQNRARFYKTINLRGHMPRFTLKMNIFPFISLESPEMCIETLRTGFVFMRQSIWGVTCLGLLEKFMFSHLSP